MVHSPPKSGFEFYKTVRLISPATCRLQPVLFSLSSRLLLGYAKLLQTMLFRWRNQVAPNCCKLGKQILHKQPTHTDSSLPRCRCWLFLLSAFGFESSKIIIWHETPFTQTNHKLLCFVDRDWVSELNLCFVECRFYHVVFASQNWETQTALRGST